MKKGMKKRAQYFNVMIVIGFMIAMTTIFIGLHSKYREITKEPIGSRQFELVKSYQEAEKFQLYLSV